MFEKVFLNNCRTCPGDSDCSRSIRKRMNLLRSRRTPIQIKITTYAEVLDFQIDKRDKVKEIFDRVCNAISGKVISETVKGNGF